MTRLFAHLCGVGGLALVPVFAAPPEAEAQTRDSAAYAIDLTPNIPFQHRGPVRLSRPYEIDQLGVPSSPTPPAGALDPRVSVDVDAPLVITGAVFFAAGYIVAASLTAEFACGRSSTEEACALGFVPFAQVFPYFYWGIPAVSFELMGLIMLIVGLARDCRSLRPGYAGVDPPGAIRF